MTSEDSSSKPGASTMDAVSSAFGTPAILEEAAKFFPDSPTRPPFSTPTSASIQATAHRVGATRYSNMPESGFVTVEVNGPRVAVTFYQLGSMDPVNTVRFVKVY